MKLMNKLLLVGIFLLVSTKVVFSAEVWLNDAKRLFQDNAAIVYEINLRTFAAQDINKNGIIDFEEKEESGTFLNAIAKLDELRQKGVNTIHVMPITPVGKVKALGTAGSLYAATSFNKLNPQLASKNSALSIEDQAMKFVNEAHKRGLRVIVDLPSCGSYDLYMQRPDLFLKDSKGQPITPLDWTDVRVLDAGSDFSINNAVYELYEDFVKMVINLGFDGIRADVATIKPAKFWDKLIKFSHKRDPQFVWLAEATEAWNEPVAEGVPFTSYDKLLKAGFDTYYGPFVDFKNWKTSKEFYKAVEGITDLYTKYDEPKSVIGSFSTHDEISPILVNGSTYSEMIIWLSATLPVNAYFVDGFDTGDNYIYMWANKKARKTYTDDDYYFVHRGKVDIFNFSRPPLGTNSSIFNNFIVANGFRKRFQSFVSRGKFIPLKTNSEKVVAYAVSYNDKSLIVIGNLNFRDFENIEVKISKLKPSNMVIPIKINSIPIVEKGKIVEKISPGEIQVLLLDDMAIK
ncbi:MAG: hypothetical protein R3Y28_04380 [Candidatus Gastranaerophilales bacterium]